MKHSRRLIETVFLVGALMLLPKYNFSQEKLSYNMEFVRAVQNNSESTNHIIAIFKVTPTIQNFKLILSARIIYSIGQGEVTVNVQKQKEDNINIMIYGNDISEKSTKIFNLIKDRAQLESEDFIIVFDFYDITTGQVDKMSITYGLWETENPDIRKEKRYDFEVETIKAFSNAFSANYIPPTFKGGTVEYHNYLKKYIKYPLMEKENGVEGEALATIFIDKNGNVKNVDVTCNMASFGTNVKRVLKLMPEWESGKLNGVPVDTVVTKRFFFSFDKSRTGKDSTIYETMAYIYGRDPNETSPKQNKERAINQIKSKELYDQGVIELQNKNNQAALDLFNQAEAVNLNSIDLYYNRALANFKVGNKEAACNDWLEAARKGDNEALDLYIKTCK